MKPYILEQTNWKQVKNQKYEVAVLPWGATEPHNYHLPYGTDSLETQKLLKKLPQKHGQNKRKLWFYQPSRLEYKMWVKLVCPSAYTHVFQLN